MDLDGDGRRDILSGSYSTRVRGEMTGLFHVLYGRPNGTFRKAEALKGTDGEPLIIPVNDPPDIKRICTRPFAVDWDADGHLDLVVGNFDGSFYWFRGEGRGAFQPQSEAINSGDVPLRIEGNHSDPFAVDWDGDGDLDLLSGSSDGGVQWAENIAGRGKLPDLRRFQMLIKPGRSIEDGELVSEDDLTGPATSTRIWVADVNGDGKLDLLVGDSVTLASPANGLTVAEFRTRFAEWKRARDKAAERSSEPADEAERAKAREVFRNLYKQRGMFMKEDDTGFVWLYLRK